MKRIIYDLLRIILSIATMPIQVIIIGTMAWATILIEWCRDILIDIQMCKQRWENGK